MEQSISNRQNAERANNERRVQQNAERANNERRIHQIRNDRRIHQRVNQQPRRPQSPASVVIPNVQRNDDVSVSTDSRWGNESERSNSDSTIRGRAAITQSRQQATRRDLEAEDSVEMQQHRPSSPDSVVEFNAVLADEEASAPELGNRWDSESDSDSEDDESISNERRTEGYTLRDQIQTAHGQVPRPVYVEVIHRMDQQQQQERESIFSGSAQEREWNPDDDDPQQGTDTNDHPTSDVIQSVLESGGGIEYGGRGEAALRRRRQLDITSAFLDGSLDRLTIKEQNAALLEVLCSGEDAGEPGSAEIPQYLSTIVQELELDDEQLLRILLTTSKDSDESTYNTDEEVSSVEEVYTSDSTPQSTSTNDETGEEDSSSEEETGRSQASGEPSNEERGKLKDPPELLLRGQPRQRSGPSFTMCDDKASSMRTRGNVNRGLPAPAQFRSRKAKKKDKSRARAMKWARSKPSSEEAKALKKKYRRFDRGYKEFSKKTAVTSADVANSLRRSGTQQKEGSSPEETARAAAAEREIREKRRVSELLEDGGLGYIPLDKETQHVRVAFENVNSIGPRWKTDKLNKDIIPSLEVDVFMFNELQRDWR
eukprot:scaffold65994_cov25-Cyclotella_meneghiniana.AAC.1